MRPRTFRLRWSGSERGSGSVELVMAAAFILIPFTMLLLSFPVQMEYHSMADAAAREAVRACATAFSPQAGQARAEAVASQITTERGLASSSATVAVDCLTSWAPGAVVSATVSMTVPAVNVMGIWSVGSRTITSSYREQIEPYRSIPAP